ncbi:putative replication protein (plasmid) [Maritalea myrionectae]|uniref:Putative replication protein n=1 Tax=Maritalea myrionectae TaxID=454601 RepID=A0A2R4MJH9_9HYPH|nr:plasmid replication protein RepC [Maritalea myrionectae]AVX06133.1 putative replication protein [Maritalea myrionectae]
MQNLGWRKPTPGLVAAEMHAQVGEGLSVPKSTAIIAVKKVAAHIGMKPAQLMLLDILFAFSKPQDWEEGQRAIVWPSNQYLMDQTGFSLPALKRHLRRLGELGLISFHDSPNGKRYGHRDGAGRIVEAYGFDLSPLAARAGELEALHHKIMAERAVEQQLRKKLTCTRRTIRARLVEAIEAGLSGPWERLEREFNELLSNLPKSKNGQGTLNVIVEKLTNLYHIIEDLFVRTLDLPSTHEASSDKTAPKTNPSQLKIEPDIQNTSQSHSNCKAKPAVTDHEPPERGFTFDTFTQACPNYLKLATELYGPLRGWEDLKSASRQMGLMIGISPDHWNRLTLQLGPHPFSVAIGLTYEKHIAGEVHNPSGYLSGMAKRAQIGTLHLSRSIFSRLSRHKKCTLWDSADIPTQ